MRSHRTQHGQSVANQPVANQSVASQSQVRSCDRAGTSREGGLALIAVLVALSILLAMTAPFLLSMGHGDESTRAVADELQVEYFSASVRDIILQEAGASSLSTDPNPMSDGPDEFPSSFVLPEAFAAMEDGPGLGYKNHFGGEVYDLQRKINLNTASPLLIGNLLGLSARLAGEHEADVSEIAVDGAMDFPDTGYLICDREVIHYGSREGNSFSDLTRGQLIEFGFEIAEEHKLLDGMIVLDFRCVMASIYPYLSDANPTTYKPYGDVSDLSKMGEALGLDGFDQDQLDLLDAHCTVSSLRESSTVWGKGERVFSIIRDSLGRRRKVQVRSAAAIGGGTLVRFRSVDGKQVEYNLVWSTENPRGGHGSANLGGNTMLLLLTPLSGGFEEVDTIVEPLVPHAVNINTADRVVLEALFRNLAQARRSRPQGEDNTPTQPPLYLTKSRVGMYVDPILLLTRGGEESVEGAAGLVGPFKGWQDFAERVFRPICVAAPEARREKSLIMRVYDNLRLGRAGSVDMGTAPISFHSAPIVHYRASANRTRFGGKEMARMERQGIAIVTPGEPLTFGSTTQDTMEELIRKDRRSPFFQTYPINTSASTTGASTEPIVRTNSHLLSWLYPGGGFGETRFPDKAGEDGSIKSKPSSTPMQYQRSMFAHESMWSSRHPEGRDLAQEGAYRIRNIGAGAGSRKAVTSRDHSRISFPLTHTGGLVAPSAVAFWFRLESTEPQSMYELSVPEESTIDRNRITLQFKKTDRSGDALVFEVMDEAGIDPEPDVAKSNVARSCGTWEVPTADIDLQADVWYHVSLSATGNRAGQLTLLVDGVPRGKPKYRTTLTAPIGTFQPNTSADNFVADKERFIRISVEDTEDFPDQGTLRIGRELFEYSKKDGSTFYCTYDNSVGGRMARVAVQEYKVGIPADAQGKSREDLLDILKGTDESFAPEHAVGVAVELYGYSVPVYPLSIPSPGSMQLADALGAFAVARVSNRGSPNPEVIVTWKNAGGRDVSRTLGRGLDLTSTEDLELSNPHAEDLPAKAADEAIAAAFPAGGGYALLVQRAMTFGPPSGLTGLSQSIGGVEAIRYQRRQGTKLIGVRRNANFPNLQLEEDKEGFFSNSGHQFISEWTLRPPGNVKLKSRNEAPLMSLYVVPISIAVNGAIPPQSDLAEWVQIYPGTGAEEKTEWVRYNTVMERTHLVKVDQPAWNQMRRTLTFQNTRELVQLDSMTENPAWDLTPWISWTPLGSGQRRIGYIEPIEQQYPAIHAVRRTLGFRGDTFGDSGGNDKRTMRTDMTSSHAHNAGTMVLPVHRFEFDWQRYGVTAARPGRNDRVALVQGSARTEAGVPGLDWHTINWSARYYESDDVNDEETNSNARGNREKVGQYAFQLVAFKGPVTIGLAGLAAPTGNPEILMDTRLIDRMVKFPSGELPSCDVKDGVVGLSGYGEVPEFRGLLDEVHVVARAVIPRPLDSVVTEQSKEFFVRRDVAMTPVGGLVNRQPKQWPSYGGRTGSYPQKGGLVMIDAEIMAFDDYQSSTGAFQIAQSGRGLLGTEPAAHDEGAMVYFLEQIPAAILSGGLNQDDAIINVVDLGGMPRRRGTVLIGGTELAHYAWSRGNETLEMPVWFDPEDQGQGRGTGLFRGRFGTSPASASSGEAIIYMPFRYWDRYRERADDPELAHFQTSFSQGSVYFSGLGWREEKASPLVDLHCLVRVDGRGDWTDAPEQTAGLYRFTEGEHEGGKLNPIARQGGRIELRFVVEYRSGAFDPVLFRQNAWKQSPSIKRFVLSYEGEPRILEEEISAR